MKAKIILKIIFSILSIFFLLFSLYYSIKYLKIIIELFSRENIKSHPDYDEIVKDSINTILFYGTILLYSILFFLIVNFNFFGFLNISILSIIIKQAKKTKLEKNEERAEKKQAKLAREIAKKQAELEKMNENTKKE